MVRRAHKLDGASVVAARMTKTSITAGKTQGGKRLMTAPHLP
jgi:hypothetical protein